MSIILQSTVGGGFDTDFKKQLPMLEKIMEEKGLDPSSFIISKDAAQYPVAYLLPGVVGNQFDYTVFVGGKTFTVTYNNDLAFLDYFTRLCLDEEDRSAEKMESLIKRFERWLTSPPDFLK